VADDIVLVNAIERNWKYPLAFHLPPDEKVKALKPGSKVQVCVEKAKETAGLIGERLWVVVSKTDGYHLEGHFSIQKSAFGIKDGDAIEFTVENVFQIYDDDYIALLFCDGDLTLDQAASLMKAFYPNIPVDSLKETLVEMKGDRPVAGST